METLRLVDVAEDGQLVLMSRDGRRFVLPVDSEVRAAVRRDRRLPVDDPRPDRPGPREVQTRIRAGADAAEVALATGLDVEYVRRFEGPVLAERQHVAELAQGTPVHRDPGAKPVTLGAAVGAALTDAGHEPDAAVWDSRRVEASRWEVTVCVRDGPRTAHRLDASRRSPGPARAAGGTGEDVAGDGEEDPGDADHGAPGPGGGTGALLATWGFDVSTRALEELDEAARRLTALDRKRLSAVRDRVFDIEAGRSRRHGAGDSGPAAQGPSATAELLEALALQRGRRPGDDPAPPGRAGGRAGDPRTSDEVSRERPDDLPDDPEDDLRDDRSGERPGHRSRSVADDRRDDEPDRDDDGDVAPPVPLVRPARRSAPPEDEPEPEPAEAPPDPDRPAPAAAARPERLASRPAAPRPRRPKADSPGQARTAPATSRQTGSRQSTTGRSAAGGSEKTTEPGSGAGRRAPAEPAASDAGTARAPGGAAGRPRGRSSGTGGDRPATGAPGPTRPARPPRPTAPAASGADRAPAGGKPPAEPGDTEEPAGEAAGTDGASSGSGSPREEGSNRGSGTPDTGRTRTGGPEPSTKRGRRRTAVPSWDEIVFGARVDDD